MSKIFSLDSSVLIILDNYLCRYRTIHHTYPLSGVFNKFFKPFFEQLQMTFPYHNYASAIRAIHHEI